ncbi:MAG: nucleotidyl transferase AbiEii/AbiGii toxin family protein [Spirochaetia bacterium]|nr:nucleotidyl transferase AbiEii/AbiGii toxin family protein [Spirochaetia bacterium]
MKKVITDFIERRNPQTLGEYDRALREIIQNIALLGLWRAGFFEHAAFYGGTALRIVYGLPRFSEDIDFSLLKKREDFSLESYLSGLKTELLGFGFESELIPSTKPSSPINSAFIKTPTRTHLMKVSPGPALVETVPSNQLLKVKLEIDTDPPGDFTTEAHAVLDPIPFHVRIFTLPDLFAGKMHCILFRQWRSRVKGRDWYDMLWFLKNEIPLHLFHLEQRMRQSGHWTETRALSEAVFLGLYRDRVNQVDFSKAADDVLPFLHDPRELDAWSREFFGMLAGRFKFL